MPSKTALLLVLIIISLIFVLHQGTSFKSVDYSSNNQPDKNSNQNNNTNDALQSNSFSGNVVEDVSQQTQPTTPPAVLGEKLSESFNGEATSSAASGSGSSYGGTRTDLIPPTQSYAPPSEEIPQPQSDTSAIGVANE